MAWWLAVLDGRATLRPNSGMRQSGPRPTRSASYSERRHGFGSGVSAASITRRSLTLSRSSCGGRTLPAINYGLALAARVATAKERPSSIRAGPAIISASIRFRLKSPTRCATMILSAPTLVPTVSTKNGATHDTNLDDLAMSEVSPLPESDTEFVAC